MSLTRVDLPVPSFPHKQIIEVIWMFIDMLLFDKLVKYKFVLNWNYLIDSVWILIDFEIIK